MFKCTKFVRDDNYNCAAHSEIDVAQLPINLGIGLLPTPKKPPKPPHPNHADRTDASNLGHNMRKAGGSRNAVIESRS